MLSVHDEMSSMPEGTVLASLNISSKIAVTLFDSLQYYHFFLNVLGCIGCVGGLVLLRECALLETTEGWDVASCSKQD